MPPRNRRTASARSRTTPTPAATSRPPPTATSKASARRRGTVTTTASSPGSSSLSPVKSVKSGSDDGSIAASGVAGTADGPDAADEDGGEDEEAGSAVADEEGEGDDEENDDDNEEEEDDEDEDGDDDDDEEGDEDEDEDEDEDGDEDEDEGEDEDAEEEDGAAEAGPSRYRYPPAVGDFQTLPEREKEFKLARYFKCREEGCECPGLFPPEGAEIVLGGSGDDTRMQVDGEDVSEDRTGEGWWTTCGRCGHGWEGEAGHGLPEGLDDKERTRRCRVVGRIEELLQASHIHHLVSKNGLIARMTMF